MEQVLISTESSTPTHETPQSVQLHPVVLGAVFRPITQFLQCAPFFVEIKENTMTFLAMDRGHIALFHFQIKIKEIVETPITFVVDFAPHAKLTRNILDDKMMWDFSDPKNWIIHQPNQTLSFPIDREGEHEDYNLDSLTEIRQQWMTAEIARSELQTLRPLIQTSDFFTITVMENGLRFSTIEFTKHLISLHTFSLRGIRPGIMNMYATRYLKDLLALFKEHKKKGDNTWITLQCGKDTPLYVGFEEKREISTWKFEAWIAPRAAKDDEDTGSEKDSQEEPLHEKDDEGKDGEEEGTDEPITVEDTKEDDPIPAESDIEEEINEEEEVDEIDEDDIEEEIDEEEENDEEEESDMEEDDDEDIEEESIDEEENDTDEDFEAEEDEEE